MGGFDERILNGVGVFAAIVDAGRRCPSGRSWNGFPPPVPSCAWNGSRATASAIWSPTASIWPCVAACRAVPPWSRKLPETRILTAAAPACLQRQGQHALVAALTGQ